MIAMQIAFRRWFIIHRINTVPDANTIRMRLKGFEETLAHLKQENVGGKSVRTPDNVQPGDSSS